MKRTLLTIAGFLLAFALGFYLRELVAKPEKQPPKKEIKQPEPAIHTHNEKQGHMKLGAFSVSLSVKDLKASKAFYENLGFSHFAGSMEQHYLIMKNGNALVGLFQGMFQGNILTFNPGWDENAQNLEQFDDVREIQRELKSKGVKIEPEVDEKATGPGSIMITDPDGNVVLIDQHR
jgi:predicted lactoylglutathione lyase